MFAMGFLLLAVLMGALLNMGRMSGFIMTTIFAVVVVQAHTV